VRHDVVHFIYMHCLLVLDRRIKRPVPMEESDRRGPRSSAGFHRLGLSSAERTEMYRIAAITVRPGYRRVYGESTNLSWKPLYLCNTSLRSVMAREECGVIRVGFTVPPGRCE
jgi:hypothetical protein